MPTSSRTSEAQSIARERVATGVVALLFLPVVADVYFGVFTGLAARIEHVLVQIVLAPAIQLDRVGGLEHDPLLLQVEALVGAAIVAALWRMTSGRARLALRWLLGIPALGAVVAVAGVGAGMHFETALCVAAAAGAAAWGVGRRGAHRSGPGVALLLGAAVVANGATMLASGPGDPPTPLWILEVLGRAEVGLHVSVLVCGLILGGAIAGAGVGFFGGRVKPRVALDPLETARRALPLAVGGVAALVYVAFTGFLGCDEVLDHEAVDQLLDSSGAFAVETVPGPPEEAAFVVFREKGMIARLGLRTRSSTFLSVADLPLDAYNGQVEEEGGRFGFPEELGVQPGGPVHVFVEIPRAEAVTALLLIDPATGDVDQVLERPGSCFVSSWAWDESRGLGVAGCEWWGDLMEYDPEANRLLERRSIDGAGEMEELVVASDGTYLAVSLWTSPDLVRIDPESGVVVDRRYVGGFNWALEASTSGDRLYLARFHARQVLELDAKTLEPITTHGTGYGVRALAVDDRHRRVLAMSTYDGYLYAVGMDDGQKRKQLRLGGWVRDIALAEGGKSLIAGGICGVVKVDLDAWLGAPADG